MSKLNTSHGSNDEIPRPVSRASRRDSRGQHRRDTSQGGGGRLALGARGSESTLKLMARKMNNFAKIIQLGHSISNTIRAGRPRVCLKTETNI